INTTEYYGEKRRAKSGLYIAGYRHDLNAKKSSAGDPRWEVIRPFESDELVSRNLLRLDSSPKGWLQFTKKYGMIGHRHPLDHWHLVGRDRRRFIYNVEHEGEWHHL